MSVKPLEAKDSGPSAKGPGTGRSIQVLGRALDVLEVLAAHPRGTSLTEIAAQVHLHKSTVHRILHTLARRGYVMQGHDASYRLGLRVVGLGEAVLGGLDIREEARVYLEELLLATNEVVHLVVMEQGEMVYIDKLEGTRTVRTHSVVGMRVPVHCTGVGKAILAHLPEPTVRAILAEKGMRRHTAHTIVTVDALLAELSTVRTRGYALDREENEEGICCVAAPVRDHAGRVVAAISVSAPAMRMQSDALQRWIPLTRATAARISARLGAPAASPG